MSQIESLEEQLAMEWQYAGGATSGGDGMSRMRGVRDTQIKLALAYLEAAETAEAPEQHLRKAVELLVDVISDRGAFSHRKHLESLRLLLQRLGEPSSPVLVKIAQTHLDSMERHAQLNYRSPDFEEVAMVMALVLKDVAEGAPLLKRVEQLRGHRRGQR
jgi:hypothetical protein